MMTIAVVDDDYKMLAKFSEILGRYYGTGNVIQQDYVNGLEFVRSLSEGLPNIVFMDIEMDVMNGREAIEKLREKDRNENTFVVFISSHTDKLVPFFSLHPFDFLVKPFSDKEVFAVLDKIKEHMEKDRKTITLIIDRKEVNIPVSDVKWVQSLAHRLEIKTCTSEEPLYCYEKLNTFYPKLEAASDDFLRIHASFAVNKRYITRFTQKEIYVNDQVFTISLKFRAEVIMKLHERL